MKDVEGKVAFITGGSSGIGLGIARAFARSGMKVVIGYQTEKNSETALASLREVSASVRAVKVDVTDGAAMIGAAAAVEEMFGKIHVLVNSAGVFIDTPVSRASREIWDWVMDVNLNGVFNGVHAFLPRIQAHGEGGHIISVSALSGLFAAGAGAYSASKFAVVGLMEALRTELINSNIGASVCCPGLVRSNILDSSRNLPPTRRRDFDSDANTRDALKSAMSDPRAAMDPEDVGELVLQGMRENALYIITHPEFERLIRYRGLALKVAMSEGRYPTSDIRVARARAAAEASIYNRERARKSCIRRSRV